MKNETYDIEKAINGDNNALGRLFGGVQDLAYNLSLRMLGNPQDAETGRGYPGLAKGWRVFE